MSEPREELFEALRPAAFGIAYRMLGSVAEARGSGALHPAAVNGQPGALLLDGEGKVIGVMALDIAGGRVQAVSSIVNPDKLRHIGPLGDLRGLLGRKEGAPDTHG